MQLQMNLTHLISSRMKKSANQFITSMGGETVGTYNAWSYRVIGKINHPNQWEFLLKKSTFSSGNLLLSSEYQNLHIASIWIARNLPSNCSTFLIRKKKVGDGLKIALSRNWNWLSVKKRYLIYSKSPEHTLIEDIQYLLKHLLKLENLWEVRYENPILSIEVRSENSYTSTIEKLLTKNYSTSDE